MDLSNRQYYDGLKNGTIPVNTKNGTKYVSEHEDGRLKLVDKPQGKIPTCTCDTNPNQPCPMHGGNKQSNNQNYIQNSINILPSGKAINTIYNAGQAALATGKGLGYLDTVTANTPNSYERNDKFAHSYLSCIPSQKGTIPMAGIAIAGIGNEIYQNYNKSNGLQENINDMKANAKGMYLGYTNPNANCEDLVAPHYPKYITK